MMEDKIVFISKGDTSISVVLNVVAPKVMAIGEKMEAINKSAYMNGYNWEAFFRCYLERNAPDILEGMEHDPEADMYVAYYSLMPENELKAEKFVGIVRSLIENEEDLYQFLCEYGEEIEWD